MDPVHSDAGEWWFWDETGADRLGPYPDEATARARLAAYGRFLDTGMPDPVASPSDTEPPP